MKRIALGALGLAAALAFGAWELGLLSRKGEAATDHGVATQAVPPAVSVVNPLPRRLEARVLVTGTLVARNDLLVAPEVEGLRVVGLEADIGDRVEAGQVLARLERETLEVQLAQRDAAIARAKAAIAQTRSAITQAQARLEEASNALERGQSLKKSGFLSDSTLDQRQAAARTAEAALVSSRDGLAVAEAELVQAEAQRRDIVWRLGKTEIRAPAAGIVSQRNARVGGVAAGAGEPMFRIIGGGEIELEAEVPEVDLGRLQPGQAARIEAAGAGAADGRVRLVSPEVDRATRLGRVRIALQPSEQLRIGSFARGTVVAAVSEGLAVPATAVQFGADGTTVQIADGDRIKTRMVEIGLVAGAWVEIRTGLTSADLVVARAGTFLRQGDAIRPVPAPGRGSEVN